MLFTSNMNAKDDKLPRLLDDLTFGVRITSTKEKTDKETGSQERNHTQLMSYIQKMKERTTGK